MSNEPRPTSIQTIPSLLTIDQTADFLQVSTKTVRRWIIAGNLISHRIGRGLRISENDLRAFTRARREE